jgi:hypothetical protein
MLHSAVVAIISDIGDGGQLIFYFWGYTPEPLWILLL